MILSAEDLGFSDDPPSSSRLLQTTSLPELLHFDVHTHRTLHPHTILPPPPNLQSLGQYPKLAPPSQTATTTATADGAIRPYNVPDALAYFNLVKDRFRERPEVYKQFLDTIEYKGQSINMPEVIQQVLTLFHGHSELIRGFNTLLPRSYRIEISSDPRQDVITVTTPMGVLTQSSDGSIGRLPQNPLSLQPPSVATSSPTPPSLQSLSVNASNLRPITPQFVAQAQIPPPPRLSAPTQTPDDAAVSTFGNTSACRRLIGRAFALHELPSLVEAIFSSKDEADAIRCLPGDGAQTFIDVIDEALARPNLSPSTRKKCLKLLYRTCGHHALLPGVLMIPICYDRTGVALYRGGFADVWKGEHCGRDVAVKVIRTYSNSDLQRIIGRFCKEVVTWKTLRHPNVLPLIGVTMTETQFMMVSDWMVNGNVNDFVKAHPDADRWELLKGVASGLIYIHGQGMVHGDLKGANILIDESGHARLADFGLLTIISDPANLLSSGSYTQGGTARWTSPELIAPQRFGFKNSRPTKHSDCYALGMVVYETISGNLPFHKHTDLAVIMKVLEGERPPRGAGFTRSLWEMLELCWTSQPNARPSIENVLQCLEMVSNSSEPPSPGVDEETDEDEDGDDWDFENAMSDTMMTERNVTLTSRPSSPVLAAYGPSIETIVEESHPPINWREARPRKYALQLGRPSSQPSTPSHGVITKPSLLMAHRSPPSRAPLSIDEFYDFMRIPNPLLQRIKQEVSVPQDKDFATMTADEKNRILFHYRRKYRKQPRPGPGALQQQPNPANPSLTHLMAPANVRNNPVVRRQEKRNGTFPGEEGGSSPKRRRHSLSGNHPNPSVQPQNHLPKASIFKYQRVGGEKSDKSDARLGSSPGQEPHNPGQPQQPPCTAFQQLQQPVKQQPRANSTFASSSTPPLMGAEATPNLIEFQQSGIGGLSELGWDINNFDQSFLRQDSGDLNFKRDFGQWFNPGGDALLDMK